MFSKLVVIIKELLIEHQSFNGSGIPQSTDHCFILELKPLRFVSDLADVCKLKIIFLNLQSHLLLSVVQNLIKV